MIDAARLKRQLSSLPTRAAESGDAEAWGKNELPELPTELLPDISEQVRADVERVARNCSSAGPQIVETIKYGTIGSVNWGGDSDGADALLDQTDLEGLAEEILESALYRGVMDGIVRRGLDGVVRIEPLIGHTEPIYAPDSPVEVVGYIHAWTVENGQGAAKWTVRVWDFTEGRMLEQSGLNDPGQFNLDAAAETAVTATPEYPDGPPVPAFILTDLARNRLPRGFFVKLLPLIKGDWVSQVRGDRTEEATAFPQLLIKGLVESGTSERSPTHIIRVDGEHGGAEFMMPGDLSQMHNHHDRKQERLRADAMMPGGFMGGRQAPSGEALREMNAKFINMCKRYANRLSRVLTMLTEQYAAAHGVQPPGPVIVTINREFEREAEAQRIVTLWREGLIEFGAAVRAASVLVPTWESKAVEDWITAEAARYEAPTLEAGALDPADDQPTPAGT